jgi:flagellar hook-length control protein FliK
LQLETTPIVNGTAVAQAATGLSTQALQLETTPTVNSTVVAQAATGLSTQALQLETTPTVNSTAVAQTAADLPTQALQLETTPTVNSTAVAQAAADLPTQALQIDATAAGIGTILPQTATNIQQTQAVQVEAMPTANSTILPQAVAGLQAQAIKAETTQDANGKASKQVQQTGEQIAIPTVGTNQQDKALQSDLSGQKDNLTDTSTFKGTQVLSPGSNEVMNFSAFTQNLDAALVSANGLTMSAKTTETQSPTTPVADVYQVLDQIVEQTKIITKPQNTEMIMKLKPEHLGELTLKVAIENGVVNASFHSNNPEVRSLLEASLSQLKQELASTGIKVDNVSVYAGLSQFQHNQDQNQNSRQQLMKFTNKNSADDFVEAIDGELTGGNSSGMGLQSGVDYRI